MAIAVTIVRSLVQILSRGTHDSRPVSFSRVYMWDTSAYIYIYNYVILKVFIYIGIIDVFDATLRRTDV